MDFDIALAGPTAKEFELGKLFYASDREQMLAYLEGYLHTYRATFATGYDLARVQFFFRKHAEVFGARNTVVIDTVHECILPPVSPEHADHFISMMQNVQGNTQARWQARRQTCSFLAWVRLGAQKAVGCDTHRTEGRHFSLLHAVCSPP